MVTISNISITGLTLKINYKREGPVKGICSNYNDIYCGGFKSCDAYTKPKAYDYNINFTSGYGTITTYSGAGALGACSGKVLSKGCYNTDESDFVHVAAPYAWFNKASGGNCNTGLFCNYSEDKITDSKGNKLCFKISNIDDESKFTNIIIKDKCDGNCPSQTGCTSNCKETPCKTSFNCLNTSTSPTSGCYDPSTRCAIQQDCINSPAMQGIDQSKVTQNNPNNLNEKYEIESCCPTSTNTYGDWCSGFYVHFDMACGSQIEASNNKKYSQLCDNAKKGGNCGIKYERIKCPDN